MKVVQTKLSHDVAVRLDKIVVGPQGNILVRLEAWKGQEYTLFSLTYRWENGWQLLGVEMDV